VIGVERPQLLWLLALLIPAVYVMVRARNRHELIVGGSRLLLVTLLILAAAGPFIVQKQQLSRQPEVTLLIDQSRSTELLNSFDPEFGDVKVSRKIIASGNSSDLKNGILRNLKPNTAYLALTDFQSSTSLDGLEEQFNRKNATLNAVKLEEEEEAAVSVEGPSRTVAGATNRYTVEVSSTGDTPTPTVTLDGKQVELEEQEKTGVWTFERQFTDNTTHAIEATIDTSDQFNANNRFYKTVDVIEKPRILVVGEQEAMGERLETFYKVEYQDSLPDDLSD